MDRSKNDGRLERVDQRFHWGDGVVRHILHSVFLCGGLVMSNMRKLSEACRKCGAAAQEYCKHCSSKKPEGDK